MSKFQLQSDDPISRIPAVPKTFTLLQLLQTINQLPMEEWELSTPVMLDQGGDSEIIIQNDWRHVVEFEPVPDQKIWLASCHVKGRVMKKLDIQALVLSSEQKSRKWSGSGNWEIHVSDPQGQQVPVGSIRMRHGVLLLKGTV